ncbi:MAG: hypothetical protein AB1416_11420 [Actinomycetota bacterium]
MTARAARVGTAVTAAWLVVVLAAGVRAALVAGEVLHLGSAASPARRPPRLRIAVALVPVVAAVYLVSRYLSFDPYSAPTLRRYADGSPLGWWVYAAAGLCLVAAGLTVLRRTAAGPLLACVATGLAGFLVMGSGLH